jgi:ATP-dependent helicase YprA (DUF1998 family)
MLIRRVRQLLSTQNPQCVGTSATLSSKGSWDDQQRDVADLGSRLFGVPVLPDDVIGETLERATLPIDEKSPEDRQALVDAIQRVLPGTLKISISSKRSHREPVEGTSA